MAHQIDTTSLNRASYASTQREWHGLGELMPMGADIETWAQHLVSRVGEVPLLASGCVLSNAVLDHDLVCHLLSPS